MPKAYCTLTVKPTSAPWPAPRDYAMALKPGGPNEVTQPSPTKLKVAGSNGKMTLSFQIGSSDGKDYRPIGFTLADSQGKAVFCGASGSPFSDLGINDHTLEFTDFVPGGHAPAPKVYKFTVYIQLPDGSVGTIDPDVENEN